MSELRSLLEVFPGWGQAEVDVRDIAKVMCLFVLFCFGLVWFVCLFV